MSVTPKASLLISLINNMHSNTDVFLRELISNSNDALDKVCYSYNIGDYEEELCIKIIPNKKNRTLTIFDNGIGMTTSEMFGYLGTIGSSGTKNFVRPTDANSMIGQFGIGFYTVYLVADQVTVTSKCENNIPCEWHSNSITPSEYNVASDYSDIDYSDNECSFRRGTKVVLYLKNNYSKYLEENNIKEIVRKYFQFNKYSIKLYVQEKHQKELEKKEEEPKRTRETTQEGPLENPIDAEYEELNEIQPFFVKDNITLRNNEIFSNFSNNLKSICKIEYYVSDPLKFNILLYVPESTSYDLFEEQDIKKKNNIKLYVGNVFIMDNCEELIPNYLSFLEGVIYSDNLPLSMSREGIQNSETLNLIRNIIVTKCLEYFSNLSSINTYEQFYKTYSRNIKLGVYEDGINRNQLAQLLRYHTSASGSVMCSLKDYVNRMKEDQNYIYFITGTTIKQIEDSMFIESLKKQNIEVIYMTDPIDEFIMEKMQSFDGKPLISVNKGDFPKEVSQREKLETEDKKGTKRTFVRLRRIMKYVLKGKVDKVVASNRLVESPFCIVNSGRDWTTNMERIVNSQILYKMPIEQSAAKKQLEINPDHIIIDRLSKIIHLHGNDLHTTGFIIFLFETALILSSLTLEKPELYINKYINSTFKKTFEVVI